jgi:hypothetical protein
MRLLTRTFIFLLVATLVSMTVPASAVIRAQRLVRPPANCEVVKLQGRVYACGAVYLTAHSDTSLLTPFGFRKFDFLGWSLGRCRYDAVWPVDVPLDSLPSQISDLEYNRVNDGPTEEELMADEGPLMEYMRAAAMEQDVRDLLEPRKLSSSNDRNRRTRSSQVTYGRSSYRRHRTAEDWEPLNWRDYAECERDFPRSMGYEYASRYGTNGYYASRSRRNHNYSNWDSDSYGSGANISRYNSGRYNNGYQPVPCGSVTTLQSTPIQDSYRDWRRSGGPFMNGNGNCGGVGFYPTSVCGGR